MFDQLKEILNESGSEFSWLFILAHSPQTTILQYEEIICCTFILATIYTAKNGPVCSDV
jgi:hypothetical protein